MALPASKMAAEGNTSERVSENETRRRETQKGGPPKAGPPRVARRKREPRIHLLAATRLGPAWPSPPLRLSWGAKFLSNEATGSVCNLITINASICINSTKCVI